MSAAFKCDVCRSLREGQASSLLTVTPRDLTARNNNLEVFECAEVCATCTRDLLTHLLDIPNREGVGRP